MHRAPDYVLPVASAEDVAAAIRWAAEQGCRLTAQGSRHSVFGRAQVDRGVVAEMRGMRAIHDVQSDRVCVDAGVTWREVLGAAHSRGLAPPGLPDFLDLSVGGTVVVGGVGAGIGQFGVASDSVVDLHVVTGRGEQLVCSPSQYRDLFDAVRAGLGQVAVITRVTLRLVPAPQQVRRLVLSYADLTTMLRDARQLVRDDRFDTVQGAVVPAPHGGWTFRLDATKGFSGSPPDDEVLLDGLSDVRWKVEPSTVAYVEWLARLDALEQGLRARGQWMFPHPWLTTFIGDSAVEAVVARQLAQLTPMDLGPFGQVTLSAFPRESVRTSLLPLPTEEVCYVFNLIRFPESEDAAEADRLMAANRAAYEQVRAAGGTLYPVSALGMSSEDWRDHFGPTFAALSQAKDKYDPRHILTPGYDIFP